MPAGFGRSEIDLLTVPEVCALLKVRPQTLNNWRYEGKGPAFLKVGRAIRYRRSAIEEFLAAAENAA